MSIAEILESSVEERLRIIGEIWDSIEKDSQFPPLTQAQAEELDLRIDAYENGQDKGYTWEEVVAKARSKPLYFW